MSARISRLLSFVLRHRPDSIGLELDEAGWANVDDLLEGIQRSKHDLSISYAELQEVVDTNNKNRFEFSEDGKKIRARQGHSIDIELGLVPRWPPQILWHGTATKSLGAIRKTGLEKRNRHAVHLSKDEKTASAVGRRHGELVMLQIRAMAMRADGHKFYLTGNDVWLTDEVPPGYILFP